MSHCIETGGPAFPATEAHGCNSGVHGMDLRDYFAAKAMAALIQTPVDRWPQCDNDSLTAAAYEMADAMLAARSAT